MLKFNDDYFTLVVPQTDTEELYYWEDVLRVAYYVHADWGYDNRRRLQTYLVVQHACGQYLKIARESDDWRLFEDNIDRYLPHAVHQRSRLLENPPVDSLIDIYVKV